MKFNALKTLFCLAVGVSAVAVMPVASAVESDFPTSCTMSTEEREESMQESRTRRASKYLLSEMPSVIDSCAFGERLKSAIDGLIGKLFDEIPTLDPLDENYFCGFGAQDAWRITATTVGQEGRRDYATWYNQTRRNAHREARGLSRQVPGQVRLEDRNQDHNWNEDNVFGRVWRWVGDDDE